MAQLSDRLNRLAPSATLAMSQKSSEMKAQGIDVINMSVGEPDFNTPDNIKQAAKKAIDENYSRYSPVPGYPDLRKAIVAKLKNENGLEYTINEVIVGTGGKQCVCNAVLALVNPGDEVIIPAPYWVSYPQMVKLAGGTPVIVNAGFDQDFKMTAEQLENAITEKTKMLILCSPSNPTGSVYSKKELAALAEVLKKHPEVFVLADEIYEHINYIGKHHSIAQEPGMKEQVIIANGVSKAYAMTGWRIGFLAGPEWIIKGCNKLQGQYTSGTCSVSQKAAEAAYTLDQSAVEEMRVAFERRRNLIVKLAKEVPGLEVNMPQGAFYLFPKCNSYFGKSNGEKTINNSTDFAMYLLEEAHVATVGGDAFGDPDCFRMSYATSDENIVEAIKRIKELDLTLKPHLDYARDMFLFSFYTRGMSFIDMAYLKKSDLKNGTITYRRRKTGQQLTVKWEKCMEDIIAKYGENTATCYLLPIITNPCSNERTQYRNAICRINVALKEVAGLAGLNIPLTMHVARHCWASVAKSKNIPLSIISEGMGHDSEETTRIYLASLDTSVVDKANSLILKDF